MNIDPALNNVKVPLLVDRLKAAELMGVCAGTIDNLRLRGELPSVKIGARRLYVVDDLHKYIASRKEVVK